MVAVGIIHGEKHWWSWCHWCH